MMKGLLVIIGCPVLEDEIVYAIVKDLEIRNVHVVENEECANLVRKLEGARREFSYVGEAEIGSLPRDGYDVVVLMKSVGLHEEPDDLKNEVLLTVRELDGKVDSMLLFYGLCGNAFKDFDRLMHNMTTPVFILRDRQGRIVDDCVAAPLGGTDGYYNLLKRYAGVMLFTPAWAINWDQMLRKMEMLRGIEEGDDEDAFIRMVFEMAGYERVLKIHTGLGDEALFDQKTREFAEAYDFRVEELEPGWCSMTVTDDAWESARGALNGKE